MGSSLVQDALQAFDVDSVEREFIAETIAAGYFPPGEDDRILNESLFAGNEDFEALIECATSIHQSRIIDPSDLGGNDLLTTVWHVLQGRAQELAPWSETDRLIARAKRLEHQASYLLHRPSPPRGSTRPVFENAKARRAKRQRTAVTSHYWSSDPPCQASAKEQIAEKPTEYDLGPPRLEPGEACPWLDSACIHQQNVPQDTQQNVEPDESKTTETKSRRSSPQKKGKSSPYFNSAPTKQSKPKAKRPPPGTVSCLPFPPLMSPSFGLVQERFAHEPFWLLVAITFLIRTKGTTSVPVFLKLKDRFPTPEEVAEPTNSQEILGMIQHLGLAMNRLKILQKYAGLFMSNPPCASKVYRVKNYDHRDVDVSLAYAPQDAAEHTSLGTPSPDEDNVQHPEAWEIGHMTQGKYAIDSWRIFCRDRLLGRAKDWNGKGTKDDFQPEWMRVKPDDKELRAYLRWMWMCEGWEWDPLTGERKPLRQEMKDAVNNGRVEYDDTGGLRIVE